MAAAFDPFAPGAMDAAVLLSARVSALVVIAPVFSSQNVPKMMRVAFILMLTLVLLPLTHGTQAVLSASAYASESLIGFAMGLGAAVLVSAAETAGDILAFQSGLSGATTLDPISGGTNPALSTFFRMLVITLLLVTGAHMLVLEALVRSIRVIPLGSDIDVQGGIMALGKLGGTLFVLGLRFAAPVTVAVLVSNLALGVLARTVPQINALAVSYPIQITVGLVTLLASLPVIASFMSRWPTQYQSIVDGLLQSLRPAGGG